MDDFSQSYEVLERAGHVFDRDGGIDATLIEQVDTVSARPLQHAVDSQFDVPRSVVEPGAALAGFQVDVPAELGVFTTVKPSQHSYTAAGIFVRFLDQRCELSKRQEWLTFFDNNPLWLPFTDRVR